MKLLILCVLVTYVTAGSMLGSKRCTWGPSYWCSHVDHAKECGAVKHCMTTVWKHQIIHPKSTEECMYCQMGFNELKDILNKKDIQDDVAKYVADICKLLPDPDWRSTCNGIVTEDLPIILQMLDEKIDSGMICATMGMCSGIEDTYSPYGSLAKQENEATAPNSTCDDCIKFFQDVQYMITSNETLDELEQLFNQVICARIPSLTELCQEAVQEMLPAALKFLAEQVDPEIICRVYGFCASSDHVDIIHIKNVFKGLKQPLKLQSSDECEACKALVTQLDNALRDKSTQTTIETYLESYICDNLGSLGAVCKQVAEEYLPQLFELLTNEMDPKTVCETVGLCVVPTGYKTVLAVENIKPAMLDNQDVKTNAVPCEICEILMQEVKDFLERNGTITEVEDLIDKICDKLPSSDLKTQCLNFVSLYGPLVIDDLDKVFVPKTVCTDIELCTAKINQDLVKQNSDEECDICILVINELETLLANVSTEEVVNDALGICDFLPGNLSATCKKYVNLYLPLALQMLKSKEDPKALCSIAQMCTSSAVNHKPYLTKPIPEEINMTEDKKDDNVKTIVTCEVCDAAVNYLKGLIGKNATKAEVKAELDKLCNYLPSAYKDECQTLVDTYSDEIIKLILNDVEAHAICMEIGLCNSATSKFLGAQTGILSPVDTLPIVTEEVKNDVTKDKVDDKASLQCEVCDTVFIYLKYIVGDNATEAEIQTALDDLCNDLPSTYTTICQSLVNKYSTEIIQVILNKLNPHTFCIDIGLCDSAVSKMLGLQAGILSPADTLPIIAGEDTNESKKFKGPAECKACMLVLNAADKALQRKATQEAIRDAMIEACKLIPKGLRSECVGLVDKEYKVVINFLILKESPDSICKKLKFCPATEKTAIAPFHVKLSKASEKAEVSGEVCVVCEFVIKTLDGLLETNASEAEIKAALENVCTFLPDTISSECNTFVAQYSVEIINLLVKSIKPDRVCINLKLCTGSKMAALSTPVKLLKEGLNECDVCGFVVTALKNFLSENRTKKEIEQYLDNLCDILPDTVTAQCEDGVKMYVPAIVDLIEQDLTSKQICEKIGLCNATSTVKTDNKLYFVSKANLLGAKECTYGPAYWCASKENAKKCDAVQHCENHVWN